MNRESSVADWITLVLSGVIAIGGLVAYLDVRREATKAAAALAAVQTELGAESLARSKDQVLLVTGRLDGGPDFYDYDNEPRRLTLEVTLENGAQVPVRVGEVTVYVYHRRLDDAWGEITPPSEETAPATLLRLVDKYARDEWEEIHRYKFDPQQYSGGTIMRLQKRTNSFDFLVKDGVGPEVLRFEVVAQPPEENTEQTWNRQVWVGLAGCGSLRGLFRNDGWSGPAGAAGDYPAEAPEAPEPSEAPEPEA